MADRRPRPVDILIQYMFSGWLRHKTQSLGTQRCGIQSRVVSSAVSVRIGSEIDLKHCAFSKTIVESLRKYFRALKLDYTGYQSPLTRNPKLQVQIPLETTNFSMLSAVSE